MARVEKVLERRESENRHAGKKRRAGHLDGRGTGPSGLEATLFSLSRTALLVEIELQYEYPDWTLEHYNNRMGEIRRYFDAKYRDRAN